MKSQEELIKNRVKNELIGTEVFIVFAELDQFQYILLGEAYKPGKYTVGGLSSLSNALFVSGGVNEQGSLRNIQVKRNDGIIGNQL